MEECQNPLPVDESSAVVPVVNDNLSEYQRKRLDNIKRNNARLRSLGLISALEEKRSNASAAGIEFVQQKLQTKQQGNDDDDDSSDQEDHEWSADTNDDIKGSKMKKKKRKRGKIEPTEGSRKSLRLQRIGVDLLEPNIDIPNQLKDANSITKEREARVTECREVRLRAAKAVAEYGAESAAKENPTATYEHCLMRVRSMTEKGLGNRIKAIERAAGKHCVVKMAIFKSCLQDEGMWELAEAASDALERLKELKPIAE
jgi:hypothetical protein